MKSMTTKEKIVATANELFKKNGYENTGIRDIAKACGVSVSNLQYYFPKKVLIMAEVYNLMTSEYYKKQMEDMPELSTPVEKIMAVEYVFMQRALSGEGSRESYISSMMIPEVCSVYAEKSTELFVKHNVCPEKSRFQILMANTIMFGGLSQILQFYQQHKNQYELEELLIHPFEARLRLLGVEDCEKLLNRAHAYAKEAVKSIK